MLSKRLAADWRDTLSTCLVICCCVFLFATVLSFSACCSLLSSEFCNFFLCFVICHYDLHIRAILYKLKNFTKFWNKSWQVILFKIKWGYISLWLIGEKFGMPLDAVFHKAFYSECVYALTCNWQAVSGRSNPRGLCAGNSAGVSHSDLATAS